MLQYTVRRLLLAIPVLLGILIVTFSLAHMIPGDPCRSMLGEKATKAVCDRFLEEQGYNKPVTTQFFIYVGNMFKGDFGKSIRYGRPVGSILIERLPMTFELGLCGLILAVMIGIPAGVLSALKRNSIFDVIIMIATNIGVSMPIYWLGLMLAYLFAYLLKGTPIWLPPTGRLSAGVTPVPFYQVWGWHLTEGTFGFVLAQFFSNMYILNSIITGDWAVLGDALKHLILPSIALSTVSLSIIARMTRSSMLEVMKLDYVRTARAKGLQENRVTKKHIFRNALLPVSTIIGLQVGTLFAGAVLTETVFGLAGIGRMLYDSITSRDYPIIEAFTVVIAMGYVLVNLIVDLSYVFIDPRIRLE
jgi:peptide/nickel transport system permease protein